jgi:ferrous iron transport protein A
MAGLAATCFGAQRMKGNAALRLDEIEIGRAMTVHRVAAAVHAPEWLGWLQEIGFLPGERVMLMAKGFPGGDPLVVRVGLSTFALRAAEAACVHVVEADPGIAS